MTDDVLGSSPGERSTPPRRSRVRHVASAGWGTLSGVAPHVLHHVGPLAGAAVLAGFGGRLIFFLLGLLLAVPMLRRLHRRFGWMAATLAVGLFAVSFAVSSALASKVIDGPETGGGPVGQVSDHDHGH